MSKRAQRVHYFIGGNTVACGQKFPPVEIATRDEERVTCFSCRKVGKIESINRKRSKK